MDWTTINTNSFFYLIDSLSTWFTIMASTLSVAGIIYAGISFITAGGNTEKISQAKKIFWFALLGGLIIIFAYGILNLIQNLLSGAETIPAPRKL